ncbi:MAG: Crp/Fnr family transcriptional regulator [Pseudomonadota bacterium]
MNELQEVLENSLALSGLPQDLSHGLAALARSMKLPAGKRLFSAGDPGNGFYAVLEGSLKVTIENQAGDEQLLAVLGPGSIVGELSIFDGEPRSANVITLQASRVAFINKAYFESFADDKPALYRHMLKIIVARLRNANNVLAARSFLPLPGRVAQIILQFADDFGKPIDGGRILVHHKISQTEIAKLVGAARENVSRVLNDWRRAGTISRISGYYCIEDRTVLEAAAQI